jgi:hypothetical protein
MFPDTFVAGLVLIIVGCLLLLVSTQGRPRFSDEPSLAIPRWEAADWLFVAAIPLATIGLFAWAQASGFHNHPALALVFLALLIGTAAALAARGRRSGVRVGFTLSRLEGVCLVLASVGLVALYAWRLDSWQFSNIGDEWTFFETADAWAQRDLGRIPWLEANGVWGFFPAALAGWQALFMRFFGRTNFSWRLSMAVLVVSCLGPLYLTLRHFLAKASATPRIAAAFGCGSFFLSEFIVVWARIGKPHAAFLPALLFAGCFFFAARARQSKAHYFLAGVASGLGCFLSSLGALLPLVVFTGFLAIDAATSPGRLRQRAESLLAALAFFAAGFLMAGAPIFVELDYWRHQIRVNLASPEAAQNRGLLAAKTVQSFFAFLSFRAGGHFLWQNVVDPISAILAAGAFGMARLLGLRRWLFLPWSLFAVGLLAGGISQYGYPPPSRMMVIMYPVALLAAVGFAGLTRSSRSAAALLAILLIPLAGAYNIVKLESWNPYYPNRDFPLLEMQRLQEAPPGTVHVLIVTPPQRGWFEGILRAFGNQWRVVFFENTPDGLSQLSAFLRKNAGMIEVRASPFDNAAEIRKIAEGAGARFGPPVRGGVPERPRRISKKLVRFFEEMNPYY